MNLSSVFCAPCSVFSSMTQNSTVTTFHPLNRRTDWHVMRNTVHTFFQHVLVLKLFWIFSGVPFLSRLVPFLFQILLNQHSKVMSGLRWMGVYVARKMVLENAFQGRVFLKTIVQSYSLGCFTKVLLMLASSHQIGPWHFMLKVLCMLYDGFSFVYVCLLLLGLVARLTWKHCGSL